MKGRSIYRWTRTSESVPNASENLASVQYPQKLIIGRGIVKVGGLFVHKKCVWHPDQLDVFRPYYELFKANLTLKGQPRVLPKLSEVHVQGEVLEG